MRRWEPAAERRGSISNMYLLYDFAENLPSLLKSFLERVTIGLDKMHSTTMQPYGVSMYALFKTFRVHQWSKNFLLFAALIFSKNLLDFHLGTQVLLGFFSFCLLSSAVYLINDVIDAEKDKLHPVKRDRPIASGKVSKRMAMTAFGGLVLGSFLSALLLEKTGEFLCLLLAYLALNVVYTFFLKRMVVADVVSLAVGFLIRVQAGGTVIAMPISPWLVLCTFFTASFLACCKRRSELALAEGSPEAREVLSDYSFQLLDILVAVTASASLLTYALYSVAEKTIEYFGSSGLIYTLPVVLFGIGRYIFLVYHRQAGEDPAAVIPKDIGVVMAVLLWISIIFIVVYGRVVAS